MKTPDKVFYLSLEATCVGLPTYKMQNLMEGATRADKKKINRLVKEHLPGLYKDLALNFYNPYNYYKTDRA